MLELLKEYYGLALQCITHPERLIEIQKEANTLLEALSKQTEAMSPESRYKYLTELFTPWTRKDN